MESTETKKKTTRINLNSEAEENFSDLFAQVHERSKGTVTESELISQLVLKSLSNSAIKNELIENNTSEEWLINEAMKDESIRQLILDAMNKKSKPQRRGRKKGLKNDDRNAEEVSN